MIIFRPINFIDNDERVVSSNVPENEYTEFGVGAAANIGEYRQVSVDTYVAGVATHKVYQSKINTNSNDPTLETYDDDGLGTNWDLIESTNTYKMFDDTVQAQTTNPDTIATELLPGGYVTAIALFNIDAVEYYVRMTETTPGDLFEDTFSLVSDSGITDLYDYFYTPIERFKNFLVFGLPNYAGATIETELRDVGGTPACGVQAMGRAVILGQTLSEPSFGILDFSVKKVNEDTGVAKLLQRSYSREASVRVLVDTPKMAQVERILTDNRAVPIVSISDEDNTGTMLYCFIEEFKQLIADPQSTILRIELQGLT